MNNNQLEKNFWKAGQTPLSATNLNLMTNAIIDNAEAISEGLSTIPEKTIKIVDKLPETNIKSNVIYGVKKEQVNYNSYLSIFGTRIPFINSIELGEQNMPVILESLNGHVREEDAETIMMFLVSYGFGPIDISTNDVTVRNMFNANLQQFIYYFNLSGENIEIGPKYFNTIEDLTKYLLEDGFVNDLNSIVEGAGADISQAVQMMKGYGYKYSTTPLSEDEFGAIYEKEVIGETYDYYIYNEKEWVSVNDIKVVKSLPSENIEVNKIYSLQQDSYESYTSAFGTRLPVFTDANYETNITNLEQILNNRELNAVSSLARTLALLGFFPIEKNNNDKLVKQCFDTDRGQFYHYAFNKYFNTLEEMSNYLLNGEFSNSFKTDEEKEIINRAVSSLKSAGFKYSTEELSDGEFGVVYKKNPTIYKYFIYSGEKWIELGKGGVSSISITVSDIGPAYEYPITDEDLKTIINNDVVVANVSYPGLEGIELSYKLFKTASIKHQEANEIVMSTITNYLGSAMKRPVYLKLIVNLITKTYTVDMEDFISGIGLNINQIYAKDGFGEPAGSPIYVSTINGENIVGSADNNITTSIKLENKTVSNWVSDATYADYPYRATITESSINAAMVAEVIYGLTEVKSGNYAPICETFAGGIYIYSKVNTQITIPTILVVK